MVKVITRAYFIIGADREDIIQEGMIGLYKAIRDYKNTDSSFNTFAKLCIERQVINAIKSANRKKHQPLNSYFSLNIFINEENTDITYVDFLEESNIFNPEQILIDKESIKCIENIISKTLSDFEKKVLSLYLKGKNYVEIGNILKKDDKSIDNAIQRTRKKISKILENQTNC